MIVRFVKQTELDAYLRLGWAVRAGSDPAAKPVMIAWLCDCFAVSPLVNKFYRPIR